MTYAQLINSMKLTNMHLNRKVLSELAAEEPYSFRAVVEAAKALHPHPERLAQHSKNPLGDLHDSGIRGSAHLESEDFDISEFLEDGDVEIKDIAR